MSWAKKGRARLAAAVITTAITIVLTQAGLNLAPVPKRSPIQDTAQVRVPRSIQAEHTAIQKDLLAASLKSNSVGKAARALATLLEPHFQREEQIALSPLALLEPLARSTNVVAGGLAVLPLTDSLRAELPRMLEEHKAIGAAVAHLELVAGATGDRDVVAFAHQLRQHARSEEEILYPAAILVGEVVRARARTSTPEQLSNRN